MNTPKAERLHICFLGRTNVGKSSIINFISNQDVSIVSDIAGTTTDIVEKTMELGNVGPVVLVDTAGMDDNTELASERKKKTDKVFDKCEFACLIVEPNAWTQFENSVLEKLKYHNIKFAIIINKIDVDTPKIDFLHQISNNIIQLSVLNSDRNLFVAELVDIIKKELPMHSETNMFDGLINKKELCLFVTPIDSGAPKGRMIMPQIQALRAILDKNAIATFVQVEEYKSMIASLNCLPQLVVTDSQVVKEIIEYSPKQQLITTFSILLARMKGDFKTEIHSVKSLKNIKQKDVILIAEACSHHAQKDDIARIKFPKLLEKYLGFNPNIEYCNGGNFPKNLNKYSCIIHCGACMLTQKEKLSRINIAQSQNVPITNFGIAISFLNGYLDRVLQPFERNK